MMNRTYQGCPELQRQMHEALRNQNPQWVEPDGESPICDEYERRFAELLEMLLGDEGNVGAGKGRK